MFRPRLRPGASLGALALCLLAAAQSCVDNVEIGRDQVTSDGDAGTPAGIAPVGGVAGEGPSGGGGLGGDAPSAGGGGEASGEGGSAACRPAACQGKTYACGDCEDNDLDGAPDAADSECTGPCDDTEDSFFGGIPGQNNAPCKQDCYFDSNTGAGNDDCYWTHECDELSVAPDYPPSGDRCAYDASASVPGSSSSCEELRTLQSATCLDNCGVITPNGCDCFGCCELRPGRFVYLGSEIDGQGSCDEPNLDNPQACRACTPVLGCLNECDPCERCVGGRAPDPGCGGGEAGAPSTSSRCEPAVAPCGEPGEAMCPVGEYCITGCCVIVPR